MNGNVDVFLTLNPTQTVFPEEKSRIIAFDFSENVKLMIAPGNLFGYGAGFFAESAQMHLQNFSQTPPAGSPSEFAF